MSVETIYGMDLRTIVILLRPTRKDQLEKAEKGIDMGKC